MRSRRKERCDRVNGVGRTIRGRTRERWREGAAALALGVLAVGAPGEEQPLRLRVTETSEAWDFWRNVEFVESSTPYGGKPQYIETPTSRVRWSTQGLGWAINGGAWLQDWTYPSPRATGDSPEGYYVGDYPWLWLTLEVAGEQEQPACTNRPDDKKAWVGDPINTINGSVAHDETDVVIPCPGIDLTARRHYNSRCDWRDSPLGRGWILDAQWTLTLTSLVYRARTFQDTNSCMIVRSGDGEEYGLIRQWTKPVWKSHVGNSWQIKERADGHYDLWMPGKRRYEFYPEDGRLRLIADAWGNTVTMSYTNSGGRLRVSRARHSNGQFLEYRYSGSRLVEVRTPVPEFGVTYGYNARGDLSNVVRRTSSGVETTTYTYDELRIMVRRENAAGVAFDYGPGPWHEGGPQGASSRVGGAYPCSVEYKRDWCMTTVHYPSRGGQRIFDYHYDPANMRLDSVVGPTDPGKVRRWAYDVFGNETNETYRDGTLGAGAFVEAKRTYDTHHNVTSEGVGVGAAPSRFWTSTWDTNYDVPTARIDPLGHRTEVQYLRGKPWKARRYTEAGRYAETKFGYTAEGLVSGVTNANGHGVRYTYDRYGRLAGIQPQAGPAVAFSNNVLGFLVRADLPWRGGTRSIVSEPDELGRVRRVGLPDGSEERFAYDRGGNVTSRVDTAGRTVRYTCGPLGEPISAIRKLGAAWVTNRIEYDEQFNVMRVIDAKARAVESYARDDEDRVTAITNLEGQVARVTYGLGPFVASVRRFDGTEVSQQFDAGGRLIRLAHPGGEQRYTYYGDDQLESAANEEGMVSNAYDWAERLLSSRGARGGTARYTYDGVGNVTGATTAAGTTVYAFDAAERVAEIRSPRGAFRFGYDPDSGLISGVTSAVSGVSAAYESDVMDRTTSIAWRRADGSLLRRFDYGFNAAGMIVSKGQTTDHGLQTTDSYEYDELDRLTRERRTDRGGAGLFDVRYAYDAVGNCTQAVSGNVRTQYVFPYGSEGNRLASWSSSETIRRQGGTLFIIDGPQTGGGGGGGGGDGLSVVGDRCGGVAGGGGGGSPSSPSPLGGGAFPSPLGGAIFPSPSPLGGEGWGEGSKGFYLHSSAGCVTSVVVSGAARVDLLWNGCYQLTELRRDGERVEAHGYDALGRRVWTAAGGVTNAFAYDGFHVAAEVDGAGRVTRSYTYGPGVDWILTMTVHGPAATNTYWYVTDHLGTVHALADASGEIVESYEYDAWGRLLAVYDSAGQLSVVGGQWFSPLGNRYLFQGREYSWSTGLYYFRARWYDPSTGRWLSKDPIGIQGGWNQYVGLDDSPVQFRDPFGYWGSNVHGGDTRVLVATVPLFSPEMARAVAAADENTDALRSGTGPWGARTGDSSRHFDYNLPVCDSRLNHARDEMNTALSLWFAGSRREAMDALGRGLHSLQDFYAHRDWDPSVPFLPDWNAHPSWYDDIADPRNTVLLQLTRQVTVDYAQHFAAVVMNKEARRGAIAPP